MSARFTSDQFRPVRFKMAFITSQALDQRYCFSMLARFSSAQFGSRWRLSHPRHWLRDHWSSCRSSSFQTTLAQGGIYYVLTFTTGSKIIFSPCYSSSVEVTSAQDGIYYVFTFTTGSKIIFFPCYSISVQITSAQDGFYYVLGIGSGGLFSTFFSVRSG